MDDFDYTLVIEYNRLSVRGLEETLKILYATGSFECLVEIEYLADEIILRLNEYQYAIRNVENKPFKHLIFSVFETLKKIATYMETPSSRIQIIHDNYHKYMYGVESPVASPVVSPISEETQKNIRVPKIMKKVKK